MVRKMDAGSDSLLAKTKYHAEGLTDEETEDLIYLLSNCFELADGFIEYININYKDNILRAEGLVFDRAPKYFNSRLFYDEKSLMVISSIKNGDEEPYSVTDTFYFEPDNIEVVSSTPIMENKVIRVIDYINEHRKL